MNLYTTCCDVLEFDDGSQVSKTASTTTYSLTINKDRTLKMSGHNGGIAGKVEAT